MNQSKGRFLKKLYGFLRLETIVWGIVVALLCSVAHASTSFYVNATIGNDSGTGAFNSPWLTTDKADSAKVVADAADNGGAIIYLCGTFRSEIIVPKTNITYDSYLTGATINSSDLAKWSLIETTLLSFYAKALNASWNDHVTKNYRDRAVIADSAAVWKLRFYAKSGENAKIDGVGIGIAGPDSTSMIAAPKRVTFGGNNSVTFTDSIDSDPITTLPLVSGNILLTAIFTQDRDFQVNSGSASSSYTNSATGDSSQVQTVKNGNNGWSTYTVHPLTRILSVTPPPANVYESAHVTSPNLVWRGGTRLTKESAFANLDANDEWFWTGGKLYLYSSVPDTANIEVPQRDAGILISNKSNITLKNLTVQYANGDSADGGNIRDIATTNQSNITLTNIISRYAYYIGVLHKAFGTAILKKINHTGVRAYWNDAFSDGGGGNILFKGTSTAQVREITSIGNLSYGALGNYHGMHWSHVKASTSLRDTVMYAGSTGFAVDGSDSLTFTASYADSNGVGAVGDRNNFGIGAGDSSCHNITIDRAILKNARNASIEISRTFAYKPQLDILIKNSYIYGGMAVSGGGYLQSGNGNTVKQMYNVYDRVHGTAIQVSDTTGTLDTYNLTIAKSTRAGFYLSGGTTTAKNNILFNNGQTARWNEVTVEARARLTSDYNAVQHNAGGNFMDGGNWAAWKLAGNDAHGINEAIAFTDTSAFNYSLTSGSPPKDAGTEYEGAPSTDYLGNPIDGIRDIGAYEYQTPAIPSGQLVPPGYKLYHGNNHN